MSAARSAGVGSSIEADPQAAGSAAAADAVSGCAPVRSVLLFAGGPHAASVEDVVAGARQQVPGATIAAVGTPGVVSPEGEREGPAVVALALSSAVTAVSATAAPAEQPADLGAKLAAELDGDRPRPALLFGPPGRLDDAALTAFSAGLGTTMVAGGGLAQHGRVAHAAADEPVRTGDALALRFDGGLAVLVGVSPGVRRFTPFAPVEDAGGGFLRRVGGKPPLAILDSALRGRTDRPLVLVLVAPADAGEGRRERCLVRGITGVDPTRGFLHVGPDIERGDRIAFGTLDSDAARQDLEAMVQEMRQELRGAVPVAALYLDCAGRGARLHGRPGTDAAILRAALGDLPIAGAQSSLEVGPFDGRLRVHYFTGVLALLSAPS